MEVKINLSVDDELRERLKNIAKAKGMKFHSYLAKELEKLADKEDKKLEG